MIIRAPVAGLILTRNVRPGDIASVGGTTPMFTMARDGLVELEAQVAEGDMAGIHVGDAVAVKLPDGSSVTGSVHRSGAGHVRSVPRRCCAGFRSCRP